jgi:hypothetical protein
MERRIFLLILATIFIFTSGCAREWKNPDKTLPAQKLNIERILVNSVIFDSAGVIVEGKVWDLKFETLKQQTEIPYTSFKLANKDGNYINVFASGHLPIHEGETVKVTGIYRREFQTESYEFVNEIEAEKIESIKN